VIPRAIDGVPATVPGAPAVPLLNLSARRFS
jgi:hypothetical protein